MRGTRDCAASTGRCGRLRCSATWPCQRRCGTGSRGRRSWCVCAYFVCRPGTGDIAEDAEMRGMRGHLLQFLFPRAGDAAVAAGADREPLPPPVQERVRDRREEHQGDRNQQARATGSPHCGTCDASENSVIHVRFGACLSVARPRCSSSCLLTHCACLSLIAFLFSIPPDGRSCVCPINSGNFARLMRDALTLLEARRNPLRPQSYHLRSRKGARAALVQLSSAPHCEPHTSRPTNPADVHRRPRRVRVRACPRTDRSGQQPRGNQR